MLHGLPNPTVYPQWPCVHQMTFVVANVMGVRRCFITVLNANIVTTVFNHIDEIGYEQLTEFSVRKAYLNKYMSQIRQDLKESTGYYECNQLLDIPLCMIKGSLNDALPVASGSAVGRPIVEYLTQQRMYGIAQHR